MQSNLSLRQVIFVCCLISLSLAACGSGQQATVSTLTPSTITGIPPTETPISIATPSVEKPVFVAFAKDGDLHLWDSLTQQSHTVLISGDVTSVTMSDDRQVIAFTHRAWIGSELERYEQLSLWTVNSDGANPREIIPAEFLRQRLNLTERESSNFYQLGWIPHSHRVIFSITKYIAQDSGAFIMTGSFERDPAMDVNFAFWRVPADGSAAEILATVTKSHPDSVTFSPDGQSASFFKTTDTRPSEIAGWFITPFSVEVGPLAIPYYGKEAFYANLHWSPAGEAFVIKDGDLLRLCPEATQDSQICGDPVHLGIDSNIITSLQWVDSDSFVVSGIEPNVLALVSLDGGVVPIITWSDAERVSWSVSSPALR